MNAGLNEKGSVEMARLRKFSVAGYALMGIALILLFYSRGLFSDSPVVITVQVLSAGLMVWARATFGMRSFHYEANPTEGGLVTWGPYRFIRHPIYASILYFAAAGTLANARFSSGLWFLTLAIGAGLRIYCEERLIIQTYPEYRAYADRTKRLIPYVF